MLNALDCPKKYTFNLADLVKPDPHRTEFFLGTLLNFCLDRFVFRKEILVGSEISMRVC